VRLVHTPPLASIPRYCEWRCLEVEDMQKCGERSSPDVVIDVVIHKCGQVDLGGNFGITLITPQGK